MRLWRVCFVPVSCSDGTTEDDDAATPVRTLVGAELARKELTSSEGSVCDCFVEVSPM